jgi:hypothetical protein
MKGEAAFYSPWSLKKA